MSGSPSWIALHVSGEPSGRVELGLDKNASVSLAVAAMIAGSKWPVSRPEAVSCACWWSAEPAVAAMSSTWSGSSSRNRSMEQSWIEHVVLVLLHVSLRRCWPSLADEWWKRTGRLLIQARRFWSLGFVDIFPCDILLAA